MSNARVSADDKQGGQARKLVMPWFSTKGQIGQLFLAILACIFGGIKAWPEMKSNEFLSLGSLLFYTLIGLVLITTYVLLNAIRRTQHVVTAVRENTEPTSELGVQALEVEGQLRRLSKFEIYAVARVLFSETMNGEGLYSIWTEYIGLPVVTGLDKIKLSAHSGKSRREPIC